MATADEDRISKRQEQVITLRVGGATVRAIAKQLGISVGLAHSDLATVMQETVDKTKAQADIERGVSLERIEKAIALCMNLIDSGDASATDKLTRLEDRRAKLLGLDAPTKVEAQVAAVTLDELDARRAVADENTDGDHPGTDGAG